MDTLAQQVSRSLLPSVRGGQATEPLRPNSPMDVMSVSKDKSTARHVPRLRQRASMQPAYISPCRATLDVRGCEAGCFIEWNGANGASASQGKRSQPAMVCTRKRFSHHHHRVSGKAQGEQRRPSVDLELGRNQEEQEGGRSYASAGHSSRGKGRGSGSSTWCSNTSDETSTNASTGSNLTGNITGNIIGNSTGTCTSSTMNIITGQHGRSAGELDGHYYGWVSC
jgi:hypothetical protein